MDFRLIVKRLTMLTGDGRCKRLAANRSPGDSKVTTGAPNVAPRRLARAPPSE